MGITPSQTIGPFFDVLTRNRFIRTIAPDGVKGTRIKLVCRVFDGENAPVNDAMIEIWQADADGKYVENAGAGEGCGFRGWGRLGTDAQGACEFETIVPGRVAGPDERLQAAHLNVTVFARGLLKHLFTRVYFADDPANS